MAHALLEKLVCRASHRVDLLKYTLKRVSAPTQPGKVAKETHASSQATSVTRYQSGSSTEVSHTLPAPCASKPKGSKQHSSPEGGRKAEGGHIPSLLLQLLHKTNKSMLGKEVTILGPDVTGHKQSSYHVLCTY